MFRASLQNKENVDDIIFGNLSFSSYFCNWFSRIFYNGVESNQFQAIRLLYNYIKEDLKNKELNNAINLIYKLANLSMDENSFLEIVYLKELDNNCYSLMLNGIECFHNEKQVFLQTNKNNLPYFFENNHLNPLKRPGNIESEIIIPTPFGHEKQPRPAEGGEFFPKLKARNLKELIDLMNIYENKNNRININDLFSNFTINTSLLINNIFKNKKENKSVIHFKNEKLLPDKLYDISKISAEILQGEGTEKKLIGRIFFGNFKLYNEYIENNTIFEFYKLIQNICACSILNGFMEDQTLSQICLVDKMNNEFNVNFNLEKFDLKFDLKFHIEIDEKNKTANLILNPIDFLKFESLLKKVMKVKPWYVKEYVVKNRISEYINTILLLVAEKFKDSLLKFS